ncbi:MAG: C4-dicarboxylate ABC transporter substrate-binding protein, partial [Candidatus Marinimicrobia bacterium]|nr:C4-dicarboxylate ABC transporter substrate-binding protein [Candidatus Neomarinimicrobiota bacterium]
MRKSIKAVIGATCGLFLLIGGAAQAKKVTIRVQSVIP